MKRASRRRPCPAVRAVGAVARLRAVCTSIVGGMRRATSVPVLLALGIVAATASTASAHTRSVSYSRWDLAPGGARVELRVPAIELTRFAPAEPPPADFAQQLVLRSGAQACTPGVVEREAEPGGWVRFRWNVRCDGGGARSIESRLFAGMGVSHVHFARVSTGSGALSERFLLERDAVWTLDDPAAPAAMHAAGATIGRYFELGVEHIAGGWDHLAFVLALLLLAGSLAEVAKLVSAFTLAHSATLALAVLGLVHPRPGAVETVIGFSIALLALENAWLLAGRDRIIPIATVALVVIAALGATVHASALHVLAWLGLAVFTGCHFGLLRSEVDPARMRAVMAFAFGLVHGLGFAGVLMEMDLPRAELLPALFGFNTGVEIGQLAVVVMIWPVLALLAERAAHVHRALLEGGSIAIFALGVFWVVVRAWP